MIPALEAPEHIKGRMNKWTPQALRDERKAWVLARAREGHSTNAIAEALRINQRSAWLIAKNAGWNWWEQPRIIRRRIAE